MSAPEGLEYKNVGAPDAAAPPDEGVIEALVAVTGVRDDVGDIIVPGAFTKTLQTRKPKVCLGHDWNRPIGKTLDIKELMPGDPALPKTTADGKPWPKDAGAVWARFQANMAVDDGKNAFHSAKFYGPESTYSIGYKATTAKHRSGTRYIHELDLFEYGPVLHPANRLATLQSIKSGEPDEIEFTDLDADEEKGVVVEELTLRDYVAILDLMEEKAVTVRRVADAEYWGLPVGTIIRPGMKPRGKGKGGSATRGITTRTTGAAKPTSVPKLPVKVGEHAVTRDGYAGRVVGVEGDQVEIAKAGEPNKTFPLADVARGGATPDSPITVKLTGAQSDAAAYTFDPYNYDEDELRERGARYDSDTGSLEVFDLGRVIDELDNELDIMEDNPERKRKDGAKVRALRKKLVGMVDFEEAAEPDAPGAPEPAKEDGKPAAKPDKPAETLDQVQKVGEELGYEVRPNPWPPEYIVNPPKGAKGGGRVMSFRSDTGRARASNGQVIPAGRVEEFMRTWSQEWEKSKDGYEPRADWVLSQMDRPAREAAAKKESERKRREIIAGATDDQLTGQAQHEIAMLGRLDEFANEGRQTRETQAAARERTERNLEMVNEELARRGLPTQLYRAPEEAPAAAHPALAEFGSETLGISTKPTGGRSIAEILDSLPVNRETQHVRYRIAHGADVLDDPGGSGVFAVGPEGGNKDWTVTVGSGFSIPTDALVRNATNETGVGVSTPKKVTAWLKAMGQLRDANGNPPPYGSPDPQVTTSWQDAEGRRLAKALQATAVPAYLAAIGKKGGFADKTTDKNWRSNPGLAATKLPPAMAVEFSKLGYNARQAYILGRTEGDDHATALQRARDMVANARQDRPTGPSYAPVNREERIQAVTRQAEADYEAAESRPAIASDSQLQSTPEGEISTDRLLTFDRSTGPAKVAAMGIPELERHDAELTRRAAALGKAGQTSPAHQAIKNALLRKRLDAQQEAADRAREERIAAETPDERRARRIAEAPDTQAAASRSGQSSRGTIALREANKELPFGNFSGNAFTVLGLDGLDAARADGATSAELARGIASDGELLARADTAERVADIIDSWGLDLGKESDLTAKLRAWAEGVRSELSGPARATEPEPQAPAVKPAVTSVAMEDGRVLTPVETRGGERQALAITSGGHTLRVYEEPNDFGMPWGYEIVNDATGNRTRSAATYRSPGSALVRAEGEFQAVERQKRADTEPTATITPELLDQAAESEAASVGLSETPDGELEVDEDVAQRQVRVEKLIKDVDAGTVKLADQSTEDLTATRRDIVDELRLQTAIARRAPRLARPTSATAAQAPKVRPGLAGAAEDHAEALRSGDAAAIERTRARLESSIRRSRTDSEIARSLADSVTSPDDNDADQLSDLAKRLRAESRERRNASARKRRTAKRIERERLRSLLGAVDTELRGRGVELERVSPELLRDDDEAGIPSTSTSSSDTDLTPDQQVESNVYDIYNEFAREEMDWVRLARIKERLEQNGPVSDADWARVLRTMMDTRLVHFAPESNTKVLTAQDRAAALRVGSEDLHLISIEGDYKPPRG